MSKICIRVSKDFINEKGLANIGFKVVLSMIAIIYSDSSSHCSNSCIIYYGLISNFRRLGAITSSSLGVICFACIIIIKKLLALSKDRYRNNWHSFFLHTTCVKHISSHNWGSAKKVEFLWNWSLRLHMYAISYWPCFKMKY